MKLTLLSDLHTEFWSEFPGKKINPQTDILVLAGDIAVGPNKLLKALEYFAQFYEHVIYVPGNHEYYNYHIHDIDDLKSLVPSNVHFLNPGHVTINDSTGEPVLFIGATLWTNFRNDPLAIQAASSMISDFKLIRKFSPASAVRLYEQHRDYIRAIYAAREENQKVVVVTHFLPAIECTAPRFQGPNLLNNYFSNDLGEEIADMSNTTWLFGHTHDSVNIQLGDTRLIANPYGYQGHEVNQAFQVHKIVEI
jgi:predicted phosphodiesterase